MFLHQGSIDIMQLCHIHCCCLPHIGILILQALSEGLTSQRYSVTLSTLIQAHAPHRKNSDPRIWILTVLDKCVDSHDDQILQLQVVCLHAVDHAREESRHFLTNSHAGNHLLNCFPIPLLLLLQRMRVPCIIMFTSTSLTMPSSTTFLFLTSQNLLAWESMTAWRALGCGVWMVRIVPSTSSLGSEKSRWGRPVPMWGSRS